MKFLILSFLLNPIFPLEKATLAGGCFWCMEPPFDKTKGVVKTISGFAGGKEVSPTYKQVAGGKTGHVEVVEIHYDEKKVNFNKLLRVYERNIDPTDNEGQFVDRGGQYRPVVFYHNKKQHKQAEKWKKALQKSNKFEKDIAVDILPVTKFYPAPDYHQDYYKKNPLRYKFYRSRSGRDQFLKKHWKK
ncbi:MAG: peptide-methionine (S)-S-oxide reductase MsrA [Halobacteriovoraceae bacterium]|nr:peptide-methionine (S)-S-oxide reductase MsrA [Halobacteriovoraceae bacterium]